MKIRIRVLAEDTPSVLALEKTKDQYESSAGIRVEFDRRDHAGVLAAVHAGAGTPQPSYDLVIVPHRMLGELADSGYVQPIDSFIETPVPFDSRLFDPRTDLLPGWWSEVSWYQGHPYGYPFQLRPMSLWYREDLFADEDESAAFERRFSRPLSIPRTTSEFEQVVEFFHRPNEGVFGTVILGRSEMGLWSAWLQYLAMFDAGILESARGDAYGDIVVNSPQAVRATEFYVSLLKFSAPDAPTYGERDAVRAFEGRRVALAVMRHDLALGSQDANPRRPLGGIGYAPLPSASGTATMTIEGTTFLITRQTSQAREAFAFMQWSLSNATQVALILNGGLAARSSAFADPKVMVLPKTFQSVPFLQIWMLPRLLTAMTARPTPTVAEADRMAEAMLPELSQMVAGDVAPKTGLDNIALRLADILKGRARLRYPPSRTPRKSPAD